MHNIQAGTNTVGPWPNDPFLGPPLDRSPRFHVIQVANGWVVLDAYSSSALTWYIETTIEEAGRRLAACVAHAEMEMERSRQKQAEMELYRAASVAYPTPLGSAGMPAGMPAGAAGYVSWTDTDAKVRVAP